MKAEEILKLIERAGMSDLKIAHIREYARIQIEKDRENLKRLNIIIIEPPITLD